MSEREILPISENHRRVISTTLGLLDETLCQFRLWAEGRGIASVLYHMRNDLDTAQRRQVKQAVAEAQQAIACVRDKLGLAERVLLVSQTIRGDCACAWSDLQEIQSRRLRGYGDPTPELAAYLDPKLDELCLSLHRIEAAMGHQDLGSDREESS
ncbi:hypothetical protein HS125_14675 [bacterium]|nr:hypothetical protein [bacterium]